MVGIYIFQHDIIFKPTPLPLSYKFQFDQPFTEHFIPTEQEELLNVIHFPANNTSKGLILYFHGNADHLQRWGEYAKDLTKHDFDVLMMDYRGYGKSTGKCDESNILYDANVVYEWAKEHIVFDKLIIYGRSLGTGVGAKFATLHPSDLVVLETPFYSIEDVFMQKMGYFKIPLALSFRNSFENHRFIPKIKCPIIIIHGTKDKVVPYDSGRKLVPLLKEKDYFYTIPGGKHKNLNEFEAFHHILTEHFSKI